MMKKATKTYQKPALRAKKAKMNFFHSNSRMFDSFEDMFFPRTYAQGKDSCYRSDCNPTNLKSRVRKF